MGIFSGKNILVIGNETNQVHGIEKELEHRGAHIHHSVCSNENSISTNIDIILLNHLHDGKTCSNFVNELRSTNIHRTVPVFALVGNDRKSIEEAVELGIADYFTPHEELENIINKIKLALGETDVSGRSVIEVNEHLTITHKTGVKVYAIEDDVFLVNLLKMRFSQAKFDFVIDTDGENALPAILDFKPQVIVLDISLPNHDGFSILKEIKDNPVTERIPVIVFSNRDGDEYKERAQKLGANAFFVKVMTEFPELISAIENLA